MFISFVFFLLSMLMSSQIFTQFHGLEEERMSVESDSYDDFMDEDLPVGENEPAVPGVDFVKYLPDDISARIFSNLEISDLADKISFTSKEWNCILSGGLVWGKKLSSLLRSDAKYSLTTLQKILEIYKFSTIARFRCQNMISLLEKKIVNIVPEERNDIREKISNLRSQIKVVGRNIARIYEYINDPTAEFNKILELNSNNKIDLPKDLPKGLVAPWPGSELLINWRDVWERLNRRWDLLIERSFIDSSSLIEHLYNRMLIFYIALINKNPDFVVHTDKNMDIFFNATNILLSNSTKYTKIRDSLKPTGRIDLSDSEINEYDLFPIKLFLSGLNEMKKITFLTISRNDIRFLHAKIFEDLDELEELYIYDSKIEEILPGAFSGLSNLKYMQLDNNRIRSISHSFFSELERLEVLGLSENRLNMLGDNAFAGLKNLKELNLNSNQLERLGATLFLNTPQIEKISLSHNKSLRRLPDSLFINLKNLELLHLSYNNIENLPSNLFRDLINLQYLDLSGNKIAFLPTGIFENLSRLKSLDLSDNILLALDDGIFDGLSELKYLHINKNELRHLPTNLLKNIKKLFTLNISHNNLRYLSRFFIERLPVSLSKIYITRLSGTIAPLKVVVPREKRSDIKLLLFVSIFEPALENRDYVFVDSHKRFFLNR